MAFIALVLPFSSFKDAPAAGILRSWLLVWSQASLAHYQLDADLFIRASFEQFCNWVALFTSLESGMGS